MGPVNEVIRKQVVYRFEDLDPDVDPGSVEILDKTGFEEESAGLPSIDALTNETGFWRRQFNGQSTPSQRKFDWYFGVMIPLVCFYFDPFVFREGFGEHAVLDGYKTSVYMLAFCSVMGTAAFLLWGERLRWLNGILAGFFVAASAVAAAVGIVILPYSLLGLIVLIGFLGLVPFATSLVLIRNSVRAIACADSHFERSTLRYVIVLTGMVSLVVPFLMNRAAN